MAIQMLTGPRALAERPVAGKFTLPVGFDTNKWAAQWVADNNVESMRGPQYLQGIPATADGWTVYQGEKGGQKAFRVDLGKEGKFVLMVRPKDIQQAVNALYGNLGKEMARAEQEGGSIAGAPLQDPGMIPLERMRKLGLDTEPLEKSEVQMCNTPVHIGGGNVDAERTT